MRSNKVSVQNDQSIQLEINEIDTPKEAITKVKVPKELQGVEGAAELCATKNPYEVFLNKRERTNGFMKPLGCP